MQKPNRTMLDRMAGAETPVELDRAAVMDQVEHLAAQGLRVLAVAGAETSPRCCVPPRY